MQSSLIIARIIGPIFVIIALGIMLNVKAYHGMYEEFRKSAQVRYLGGYLALLFGLVILQFNHSWEANWTVVITILGWIGFIKGVIIMIAPDHIIRLADRMTKSTTPLLVNSVLILLLGAFLSVKGYWP
jgi:hypothetical protein